MRTWWQQTMKQQRPTARNKDSRRKTIRSRLDFDRLEDRTLMTAGALDATFGTSGKVMTDFFSAQDIGRDVAIQTNGKIVVSGMAVNPTTGYKNFAVARYNSDGTLDTSFDGDGRVTIDLGVASDGLSVVVQADGRIVIAGLVSSTGSTQTDFGVVRLNANGSLDTSFGGGDGIAITDFGLTNDTANPIKVEALVQGDGKIVVAGSTTVSAGNTAIAVVRYTSDGSLDTSFDGDGLVITDLGGGNDKAWDVVQQADGKLIVAGTYTAALGNTDFAVIRYNTNGSLDSSFGFNGVATLDFSFGNDEARKALVLANGTIVVAGESYTDMSNSNKDFALARFTSSGAMDMSFGNFGKVRTDFADLGSTRDELRGLAIQANGKLVVAGDLNMSATSNDFGLARYNADGSLDTSFDGDGRAIYDFNGGADRPWAVAIQSNQKIVAVGLATVGGQNDFGLVRLEGNDAPTNVSAGSSYTVAEGGMLHLSASATDIDGDTLTYSWDINGDGTFGDATAASPNVNWGKLNTLGIVDGPTTRNVFVRVDDGFGHQVISSAAVLTVTNASPQVYLNLDPNFGTQGVVTTDFFGNNDQIGNQANNAMVVQPDGKIITLGLATPASGPGQIALARYNVNGTLDSSFGTAGKVTTVVPGATAQRGFSLILLSDGRFMVGGGADFGAAASKFLLIRYNADGSLDTSFGSGGIVTDNPDGVFDQGVFMVHQPDGKFVLAGTSRLTAASAPRVAVARFNADGSRDTSFGTGGISVLTSLPPGLTLSNETINSMGLQSDGRIVLHGAIFLSDGTQDGALVRFNSDGSLDTSFGSGGWALIHVPGGNARAHGILVLPDDSILTGNNLFHGPIVFDGTVERNVGLVKFTPDGILDGSFGTGGIVDLYLTGFDNELGMAVQPDGKILQTGWTFYLGQGHRVFTLIRYNSDGTLDSTFGTNGIAVADFPNLTSNSVAVPVLADGKVYLGGFSQATASSVAKDFALARILLPETPRYSVQGATFTAPGGFTDNGSDNAWTATVNYGDGTGTQPLSLNGYRFNLSHVYTSTSVYTVTVTVTDKDGAIGTVSSLVHVIGPGGPYTIAEGQTVSLGASNAVASLNYSWDVNGDGVFGDAFGASPSLNWLDLQALGIDDGPDIFQVKVQVDDGQGPGLQSPATTLTLTNTAPTATLQNNGPVSTAASALISFINQFDPSITDTDAGFTYSFDLNNDGDFTDFGEVLDGSLASISFSSSVEGSFVIHGRIKDKDGGFHDSTTTVVVVNMAPSAISGDPSTPYLIAEGDDLALTAAGSFDPDGDPLTYSWDVNGDGTFGDAAGFSPTLTWAQLVALGIHDGPSSYAVRVRVSDNHGHTTTSDATPLLLTNTAPTLSNVAFNGPIREGQEATLTGTIADPCTLDSFELTVNWGDGSALETFALAAGTTTFSLTHQFRHDGAFFVSLSVQDDDNGTAGASAGITVANVDIIVSGPDRNRHSVRVYDAVSRELKFTLTPYGPRYLKGLRVAVGDVTGDDVPDIVVVSAVANKAVRVYDGATGQRAAGPLGSFRPFGQRPVRGLFVAVAPDANGDGRSEIVVATGGGVPGRVQVVDAAAPGHRWANFLPYGLGYRGPVHVAAGDLVGGGSSQVVTSPGQSMPAVVRVFNAQGGALISSFQPLGTTPAALALAVGDLNDDDLDDIVVAFGKEVRIYQGQDPLGQPALADYFPYGLDYTGAVRVGLTDGNSDGRLDVLTASGKGQASGSNLVSEVKLWTLTGGPTLVDSIFAEGSGFLGGLAVAGGGWES